MQQQSDFDYRAFGQSFKIGNKGKLFRHDGIEWVLSTANMQAVMSEHSASQKREGRRLPQLNDPLNEMEQIVFDFAILGKTNAEIVEATNLKDNTVKVYLGIIYQKKGVKSRRHLMVLFGGSKSEK